MHGPTWWCSEYIVNKLEKSPSDFFLKFKVLDLENLLQNGLFWLEMIMSQKLNSNFFSNCACAFLMMFWTFSIWFFCLLVYFIFNNILCSIDYCNNLLWSVDYFNPAHQGCIFDWNIQSLSSLLDYQQLRPQQVSIPTILQKFRHKTSDTWSMVNRK